MSSAGTTDLPRFDDGGSSKSRSSSPSIWRLCWGYSSSSEDESSSKVCRGGTGSRSVRCAVRIVYALGVPLSAVVVVLVVEDVENRCLVSGGVRNADRHGRFSWRSGAMSERGARWGWDTSYKRA
jgi:hypothetical protein